jgi:hypothetical protein
MVAKVAVLTIATNNYKDYWYEMVKTLFQEVNCELVLHVASDDLSIADGIPKRFSKSQSIKVHEIPPYGWPEATLLRFKIYKEIISEITQEYICYLDADMLVHGDFVKILEPQLKSNNVILIQHPGFYRPKKLKKLKFYSSNPICLIKDLKKKVVMGSLGSWETDPRSAAFVPRGMRKNYVCGGFWIGRSKEIKKLISELAIQVDRDMQINFIAKWHDESHLNQWATVNNFKLADSSFCFDETYANLEGLERYISAVRKNDKQKLK